MKKVIFTIKSKKHIGRVLSQIGRVKVMKIGDTNKYTLDVKYDEGLVNDELISECKQDILMIDKDATVLYKVEN